MGFFSFFTKEKKETLDKGLSKTKQNVFTKITRAIAGKSKVDDEVLDNLEEVLITSDVGVETTLKIIDRVEKRVARDKYVTTQELTGLLRDEIATLLTENNTEDGVGFDVPADKKPYVIMVVHHGCGCEWRWKDDDDRQIGLPVQEGGQVGLSGSCRYLPCGRCRATGYLE